MSAPARGYQWAPFEAGHELSIKHGARSERKLRPIVDALLADLAAAAPWTSAAPFVPTVQAWAHVEAQAVLYRRRFDDVGLETEDGDPMPGLVEWDRVERRAANLRAELGLTPAALTRLLTGLSRVDGPAVAAGLDALRAAGRDLRTSVQAPALEAAQPISGNELEGDTQGGVDQAVTGGEQEGDGVVHIGEGEVSGVHTPSEDSGAVRQDGGAR